ncbi:lysozyme inhibitor LprI family protein [Pseudomonas mucidolens]|uniref:lysozyme inhibitor LprI family protein n=1 Tax=Pseudomonas mucidolens TaxID=46679 RepID=UPI0030DAE072
MKPIFLALALIASAVHAAEDPDSTPCDGIENDKQTLECASYNKTTAAQLLNDNYHSLQERLANLYGSAPSELADITARLKDAQQKWEKLRDADCAIETFPAVSGSKAYAIAQNDCLARMSDERSEFLESIGQE